MSKYNSPSANDYSNLMHSNFKVHNRSGGKQMNKRLNGNLNIKSDSGLGEQAQLSEISEL